MADDDSLNKQKDLSEIAITHANVNVCLDAVRQLDNQSLIKQVAANATYMSVRFAAVDKMKDRNLLSSLLRNTSGVDKKKHAIENGNCEKN